MKSIVKTGRSVDEAVNDALEELQASLDDVDIEILEEAKSGFLGLLGGKSAVVRVSMKANDFEDLLEEKETPKEPVVEEPAHDLPVEEEVEIEEAEDVQPEEKEEEIEEKTPIFSTEDPVERAKTWLEDLLKHMHIDGRVQASTDEEGNILMDIVDLKDVDMGIVIGRRAETLNAIQYLIGVTLNHQSREHARVFIDVGGYRDRRKGGIEKMALRTANKVRKSRRQIKLEPMNAYERRIVHTYLQSEGDIETVSEGREPYRRVVIRYKR